jgi:hypothetical protein
LAAILTVVVLLQIFEDGRKLAVGGASLPRFPTSRQALQFSCLRHPFLQWTFLQVRREVSRVFIIIQCHHDYLIFRAYEHSDVSQKSVYIYTS